MERGQKRRVFGSSLGWTESACTARRLSLREIFMGVAGLVLYVLIALDFRVCSGRFDRRGLAA